ncbi:DUF3592 domain-containing protein [Pseudomonas sp. NPDC089406]|uniref:DUF3592 domain-containing protein n=1 Tax=Pseudomonas sp. NPDC089406 TaxID=3364463 RepID=UPI0038510CDD
MFQPREAERDHLYTRVVWLTIACCALMLLAMIAWGQGSTYAALQLDHQQTNAKVIEVEPTLSDQAKIIHYQYTDRSGQAYTNTFFNDGYGGQVYEVGQELAVSYSGWFPQKHGLSQKVPGYRADFIMLVGGIVLTLLCLAISFRTLTRLQTMKQERAFY